MIHQEDSRETGVANNRPHGHRVRMGGRGHDDDGQPLSLLEEVSGLIFSTSSLPGDGVTLLGIERRVAAVGRTRVDSGDREKFPSANQVSFQRYRGVSPLLEV